MTFGPLSARLPHVRIRAGALALLTLSSVWACQNLDRYGPDAGNALGPPSGLTAAPGSPRMISLTWNPPAAIQGSLTYRVFRGGSAVGTTQTQAFSDDGLAPSTTYTYTVVAIDQYGALSPSSSPASATTLADGEDDGQAPTTPNNLTAVAGSSSAIGLTWSPSSDDVAVLGYRIYRGGVEVGLSSGPQYTDQGLAASTEYTYTVAAFDGAGNISPPSAPATTSTLAPGASDGQAPTTPTSLNAVPASSSAITLTWTGASDNVGVLGYRIYRGGTEVATSASTTFTDEGLSASTAYTYTVAAYDAANNTSPASNPASATTLAAGTTDTEAPTAPSLVVAVASGPTGITASWAASTDNVGVLGYRVFRDGVQIATTASLQYADGGLTPSTTYTYTVAAYDAAGNVSDQSAGASATTLPLGQSDTEPPSVPTGLVVSLATSTSLTLSWNASTDNVGVTGYVVYHNGTQLATTVATTFTHTGLCPATAHQYTVAAVDAAENMSAQSSPLTASTLNVTVNLGVSAGFGVLGGSGISITGLLPSIVHGDLGSSPGNSLVGGLLLNLLGGVLHLGDATAAAAQVDLSLAINGLAALPACQGVASALGGLTLNAGVSTVTGPATLTGTLTLDAGGDPNAVFIIKTGALNVGANAQVVLVNGAQAQNVYWQVAGSATIGASANVKGSILSTGAVTVGLLANVQGRLLSRTGTIGLLLSEVGL